MMITAAMDPLIATHFTRSLATTGYSGYTFDNQYTDLFKKKYKKVAISFIFNLKLVSKYVDSTSLFSKTPKKNLRLIT